LVWLNFLPAFFDIRCEKGFGAFFRIGVVGGDFEGFLTTG
jgi:hypothetical protein